MALKRATNAFLKLDFPTPIGPESTITPSTACLPRGLYGSSKLHSDSSELRTRVPIGNGLAGGQRARQECAGWQQCGAVQQSSKSPEALEDMEIMNVVAVNFARGPTITLASGRLFDF